MASILNVLLLLVLFSFSRLVPADDKLVEIVCHETDQPDICIRCVKSEPNADVVSKLGIATAVIGCLEKHGTSLGANMSSIASGTKDDHGKHLFDGCSKAYLASNKDLLLAVALLKGCKYDGAEKAVTSVLYRHDSCRDNIESYKKVKVPNEVAYEMKIFEDLCQAADRIIERL